MADASGVRALRIVVFVVGLGEFLTSILIGMFQFLVGSAILAGSRQAENPAVHRFAVWFNVVSAVFWVYYLFSYPGGHRLFHAAVIGFLIYHVIMTAILLAVRPENGRQGYHGRTCATMPST